MIGTGLALLGTAAISAGVSAMSASKNSKAIKRSTQAQQQSADQQVAFQREARDQNIAALSPFMTRGNIAGDTINAALGLGGSVVAPQAPGALTVPYNGGYPDAAQYPGYNTFNTGYAPWEPPVDMGYSGQPQQPQQTPQQAALNANELFKSSTGYQTRLAEGFRGLNASYAGRGVLQSGAAVKSALRYGQEFASNEFGNWLGALGNQQSLGFAGASALAGVSQGSADRLGAISQNSADNSSAAAIARAQNQGALWTGLAGTVGNAVGALSSYRPPAYMQPALGTTVPHYGYG